VFYAGHYATETVGVTALGRASLQKFDPTLGVLGSSHRVVTPRRVLTVLALAELLGDGAVVQCVRGCAGAGSRLAALAGHHAWLDDFRAARLTSRRAVSRTHACRSTVRASFVAGSALIAATATLALPLLRNHPGIVCRLLTGAALAGVYPRA